MRAIVRLTAAMTAGLFLAFAAAGSAGAQSFNEGQRQEIIEIVKEYLLKHPEILQQMAAENEKQQQAAEAERHRASIAKYSNKIFNSQHQVVLGNPNGDVTLVEFFDYNCPYCRRAVQDLVALINADPKLRVVLKEFPVLGPASLETAQVAIAVRMQDRTHKKYYDFHTRVLGSRGPADRARALATAKEIGLDMGRLEKDMKSDEVRASLQEVSEIAEALGLNGTPSYVVGSQVVIGAVGAEALREQIDKARRCGGKVDCS